ncbi:MAG TPA: hypothetical protein VEC12_12250 [Bacteroidia bacterium]|nr:hypothetical protein [Bacteroidia bacterium]
MTEVTSIETWKWPFKDRLLVTLQFPKGIEPKTGEKYLCEGKVITVVGIVFLHFREPGKTLERREQKIFDCGIKYEEAE